MTAYRSMKSDDKQLIESIFVENTNLNFRGQRFDPVKAIV